jgi:tetratricopeptide (TPR) repeat protein
VQGHARRGALGVTAVMMPDSPGERYDFFLSRRGSVAAIAREVADVLTEKGYRVLTQDYDIPLGASFVEAMHEAIINSRDLIILLTEDYLRSPYTRKEFTSFEAERVKTAEERHIIVLRCEEVPLRGLLADNVYQTLVGIEDPAERKRRIIAAAERQSQATPPPARPFIGVPLRIASFTGRADALDRLDAILMRDKAAAVTQVSVGRAAVQGMGGVGKTALAVEYAHRYRNLYAGVCWCPAETLTGLLSALANLAVTLGAATPEEADVEKTAKAALRRLAEQRATWLLVYDNVTAPDQIADLLPSAGARVLITSRFSDWSEVAGEVALDVLSLEEAVALLESRTGRSDPGGAKILAEALGRLPLALDHAAAYCKRTQMSFADYAAKVSVLIDAAPRGAGYPRSVAATFDLAIAEAVAQCQSAKALMAYLALCAPERIPMLLVEGALEDQTGFMKALAAVAEVSLVKHDPFEDGAPAVMVHRLVQAVARALSAADGSAQDAVARLIARLVAIYPEESYTDPRSWPLCGQLTPHLLARRDAGSDAASEIADWPKLLDRAGSYFHTRAAYRQAVPLFSDALGVREKLLGPEHPDTATSLNNLALLLQHQGDLAGVRPLFERALVIWEKALGPEHPDTLTALNNLGCLLMDQNNLTDARPLFERALASREKVLGPAHPKTATSLGNLGSLMEKQGKFTEARPLYERALAICEKVLGPEHPDTAGSLHSLGLLLQNQGKFTEARPLYQRALAICEKVLGPEHPQTAGSLHNIAFVLEAEGDLAGARPVYERTLALFEKLFGPEHSHTATILSNLARLLSKSGHEKDAEPLFQRAIAIGQKALGVGHPLTHRYRSHCARLFLDTGRPADALAFAETALAIHAASCGPSHIWTCDAARVTADALDALGRREEAKVVRERYGLAEAAKPKPS